MFPWIMIMQAAMANKAKKADEAEARQQKILESYAKGAAKYGYPTEELDALAFNKQISDADAKSKQAFGGQMLAGMMGGGGGMGGMFGGGQKAQPQGLTVPQQEQVAEDRATTIPGQKEWLGGLWDDLEAKNQAKANALASRPYRAGY